MPKNIKGSKPVVNNDAATEKGQNDRIASPKDIVQPIKIISMAVSQNGIFFGLSDDGKVYRLNDGHQWETIQ